MNSRVFEPYLARITRLSLDDGGFACTPHGQYRPDFTAWAVLVLRAFAFATDTALIERALNRLSLGQAANGSVSISPDQPDAIWPTPLAILAWHDSPRHQENRNRAVQFLLHHTGVHLEKEDGNTVVGHDTTIPGWPWISETHSWVQPTALCMMALSINGYETHQRVREGERMILDRQLPQGGWNYGNTTVLGKELQPFPESTGMALNALAGRTSRNTVDHSLRYLLDEFSALRTPLSLCWGLWGLQSWGFTPPDVRNRIIKCLSNEARYGKYDPVSLCVLLGAAASQGGFESFLFPSQIEHVHAHVQ